MINTVVELALGAGVDPDIDVQVGQPDGTTVSRPVFVGTDGGVRVRFRVAGTGEYLVSVPGRPTPISHTVTVAPGEASVPYLRRSGRQLVDHRGEPWLWLADTWWFALCDRVSTEELAALAERRVAQGFSAVQVVAGLLPEVAPFAELGALDGRWPWRPDWTELDPVWWEAADRRLELIIEHGLVPVVVGAWSYYLLDLGVESMVRHWRELNARWGAHPVVWCLAGEVGLPRYADIGTPQGDADLRTLVRQWQEVAHRLAGLDAYGSVRTAHPWPMWGLSVTEAINPDLLDLVWLQTGHADHWDIEPTLAVLEREVAAEHGLPVINSEVCYEGIGGGSEASLQRFLCYSHLLRGAAGHSYGAQGLWAFRRAEDPGPGLKWGTRTWQQAAVLPGGEQVGRGAQLLRSWGWGDLRPAGPSVRPQAGPSRRGLPYAARSADTVVVYLPSVALRGPAGGFRELVVDGLTGTWTGRFVDPRDGTSGGEVAVDPGPDGSWVLAAGLVPTMDDWLLVLQRS